MLSDEDIQKLIGAQEKVFATKEDLAKLVTLKEFDERMTELGNNIQDVRTGFDALQTAVDAYAKRADAYFQEMVCLVTRLIVTKSGSTN